MPSPVSTFSPFTPFTPAPTSHAPGGYFDRPTVALVNVSSPLSGRPTLCRASYGSSNSSRLGRTTSTTDSARPPIENGWRVAWRMREESLSAWEHQVKSTSSNNVTCLRDPRKFSTKPCLGYTQRNDERSLEQHRSTSLDRAAHVSIAPRPSRLALHVQEVAGSSDSSFEKTDTANLHYTNIYFDPSCQKPKHV